MTSIRFNRARWALLTTTAMLALPGVAQAQDASGSALAATSSTAPGSGLNPVLEAQTGSATFDPLLEPHTPGNVITIAPEPEILIANPGTPTTARDPVNITGIGQMFVNNGGGSVGLCTGTLINPRTVIFAAHCVNSRAQTAYGAGSGGTPIAFGFETYTRANAPGQPDELLNWFNGGSTGPGINRTNIAQAFYNVNQVVYNQLSLEPAARSFLYGDVALATLDTPAANVPTWALLFSPLPNPGAITAAGTGYRVSIHGYGGNGTGTSGNLGIDFRRRAAENMIGALTDLDTFEQFLFGATPTGLTQNLYFMDFDDPLRGLTGASVFDFNAFRDNARFNGTTPTEGTTAGGDSGGPLIVQNFTRQVVAGVLSGGYTRFFNGQPTNSYGTVSFYQPLYLYWDWIAANNPYHYVSANAGDGQWTDPTRWTTTLDPAYTILSGGSIVNGLPTNPGEQSAGTSGDFGQACFQTTTSSECLDLATNTLTVNSNPIGTADNGATSIAIANDGSTGNSVTSTIGGFDGVTLESQAGGSSFALPAATLANGLPGATNFVPNNVDPVRTTGALGRYFDVTLSNAGTTTLSGAAITIDRLTIGTAAAGLRIDSTGSLTSLINVSHFAGVNTVNGTLTSVGDYSFFGGTIMGTGRINAPFLTSVSGGFAPGTVGTVGTLTVGGNLVLGSASVYGVDLGANGLSDRIAVVANGTSTGVANVGGTLAFSQATPVLFGNTYTILTAAGGVTGTFNNPAQLSAILKPTVTYLANSVVVSITANTYVSVVSASSPVQLAFAGLLDRNRGIGILGGVYALLDLQNAATIQSTLEGWAPRTEALSVSMATSLSDSSARFYRERTAGLNPGNLGGTIAYLGAPNATAKRAASPWMKDGATALADSTSDGSEAQVTEGALPETMSVFFAGGILDGDSAPMPTAVPAGGRDDYDGEFFAAGLEFEVGPRAALGISAYYSQIDGQTAFGGQTADADLLQGSVYGKVGLGGGLSFDGVASAGRLRMRTSRTATLLTNTYTLTSSDDVFAFSGEVGLGKMFGTSIQIGPRIAMRASRIDFGPVNEVGGGPALRIDRKAVTSAQARASLEMAGRSGSFRPFGSVAYVHDFADRPALVGANFVGGTGTNSLFALTGTDHDWAEVSGGIAFDFNSVVLSLSADTTIGRDDITNHSYRGTLRIRF